jgi:hypothetical protein
MRRIGLLAVTALLTLALPGLALATASSAWIKHATHDLPGYPGTTHCTQATIEDVATNMSHVRAHNGSLCTSPLRVLPTGWLGVRAHGLRDGTYCGDTSWWSSNRADSAWWVKQQLCSNPAGTQEFWTVADTRMFDGSSGYFTHLNIESPSQNY